MDESIEEPTNIILNIDEFIPPINTSDITEGTNLYYTNERARLAISAGTGLTYDNLTGIITNSITTTSNLTEGTNLYYTNERARLAISAGTGINYDNLTGIISSSISPSALTGTSDTNVTISLGGSYNTSLLADASITLGWTGQLSTLRGGTGLSSYELGDVMYSSAINTLAKLAGNTTTAKRYLTQTGTGSASAAPVWSTIAASELTGTSLPSTITSSSLTTVGAMTNLTATRHIYINSSLTGSDQNVFYVDDGLFGTYTGSRFGSTGNVSGYANKTDVLSYTRLGISNNGGPGYAILGLRPPIDRYQNDGAVCPRESTLTLSRNFYNGGVGASGQGEGMDLFHNKYPEYPLGTGINYGIALTKTGDDSLFREFSINYRCPTSDNPIDNSTSIFRILPHNSQTQSDITKVSLAKIRFENSNIEVAGYPINYLSNTDTVQNISSISLITNEITLSSPNTDLYTGMSVIFNTPTTDYQERPGANICNTYIGSSGQGIISGTGTISVVAGSTTVTGTGTNFLTQQYFTTGAIITFGQYAYTVLSITNDTSLILTENVFANGTLNNQKWYYAYPSTHPTYFGRLARGGEYFAIVVNSTTIKLANTYDNAMKGTNIIFSSVGNGAQLSISYNRYTSIKASDSLVANTNFILPSNAPSVNNILTTDASGNTSWTATPTLTSLTLDSLTGILKASAGLISGSASTTDLTEGTNLYYTDTRARLALSAGTGISYDNITGIITATGGVSSITGTSNQVIASNSTGAVTLSLPQSISTSSSPQFTSLGIGAAAVAGYGLNINAPILSATNYGLYMYNSSPYVGSNDVGLWINNTFTPSTTGSSLISTKCTPTFNTSSGVVITAATGFDSSPSFNAGIGSSTYTTIYGISTNPVLTVTNTSALTVGGLRCSYINPTVAMSGAAHILANLYGLYVGTGFTGSLANSSSITNSYGIFINGLTGASTNYGLYISGGFTRGSDNAFRIASAFTPTANAIALYAARITPSFTSSLGLTHTGVYGLDVNPTFSSSTTGTYTTIYGLNSSPTITASGVAAITINGMRAINIIPNITFTNAAHVLTNYYGMYVDVPNTTLNTGSITYAYGGYFRTPTGTNASALYADTISCGSGGVTVPASTILYVSPSITKTSAGTLTAIRIAGSVMAVTANVTTDLTHVFANATMSVTGGTGSSVAAFIAKTTSSVTGTGTITDLADYIAKSTLTYAAGTLTKAYGYLNAQTLVGTTTIPVYYGFYAKSPTLSSGTITTSYGMYVEQPANGSNTVGIYTDSLNVGTTASGTGTTGRIKAGSLQFTNVSVATTQSVLSVYAEETVSTTWFVAAATTVTANIRYVRVGSMVTATLDSFNVGASYTATNVYPYYVPPTRFAAARQTYIVVSMGTTGGSVLGQIYLNAGTSFTLVAANGNAAFSANNNTGPNNTAITFTYSLL